MRALALYVTALALMGLTNVAQAQYVRLSWDNCDPQVPDKTFSSPGIYKLVVSATGLTGAIAGYDCTISIGPDIQDAWRFDVGGCQDGAVSMATKAASKTCPSLCGGNPLPITLYGYDASTQTATVRLAVAFDSVTANPATRYTLWQVSFDHTYSVAGADSDSVTCDNAGPPYGYSLDMTTGVLFQDGQIQELPADSSDQQVTWNGGVPGSRGGDSGQPVPIVRTIFPRSGWAGTSVTYAVTGTGLLGLDGASLDRPGSLGLAGRLLPGTTDSRAEFVFLYSEQDTGWWDVVFNSKAGSRSTGGKIHVGRNPLHDYPARSGPEGSVCACFRPGTLPLTGPDRVPVTALGRGDPDLIHQLTSMGATGVRCLWPELQPQPTEVEVVRGKKERLFDFGNCYQISFDSPDQAVAARERLAKDPAVQEVWLENVRAARLASCAPWELRSCDTTRIRVPYDPLMWYSPHYPVTGQWYLNHTSPYEGTVNEDIQSLCAWQSTASRGNSGIVIGFIDTGIDGQHPDLQHWSDARGWRVLRGLSVTGGDPWVDTDGHGTLLAGLAAAITDNGSSHYDPIRGDLGMAGVAGGWAGLNPDSTGVRVYPYQAFWGDGGAKESDLADAINWLPSQGVRVINMSWFYDPTPEPPEAAYVLTRRALQNALKSGATCVAAVGQSPNWWADELPYPARFSEWGLCVAVTATDECGNRAMWEGTPSGDWYPFIGYSIDVAAPGTRITSTTPMSGTDDYLPYYDTSIGSTSLSAALVSGVVGSMLSVQPRLRDLDIQKILRWSAANPNNVTVPSQEIGFGRVDHAAATAMIDPANQNLLVTDRLVTPVLADTAYDAKICIFGVSDPVHELGVPDGCYTAEMRVRSVFATDLPTAFVGIPRVWVRCVGTNGWMPPRGGAEPQYFSCGSAEVLTDSLTERHVAFYTDVYRIMLPDYSYKWVPNAPEDAAVSFAALGPVESLTGIEDGARLPSPRARVIGNPATAGRGVLIELRGAPGQRVEAVIYDISGRRVARISGVTDEEGGGLVKWDCRAQDGASVEAGVYLYDILVSGARETGKVIVLR